MPRNTTVHDDELTIIGIAHMASLSFACSWLFTILEVLGSKPPALCGYWRPVGMPACVTTKQLQKA